MKNKISKGAFVIAIISLMIACQEREIPMVAAEKERIKSEIQAMEDAFAKAFNEKNTEAISYYADDAISYSNNKMPLMGKNAIHESIKEELAKFPKGAKITFKTKEVHIANDGNQVVEVGGYQVSDSTNTKMMSGTFMSLFEKKDGKYICIRDMANSDIPIPKK
ncbi:YybH family protein [Flavobacterium sp. W1B]|uniref:YybH family protein n=1 Tax=Flavobacterium sp. W1B TaxID=3394146 RepID=UPI0039BC592B